MSEKLKSISQLGIEIIESIKSKKSLDNEWKKSSSEIIQSAKEPVAQTELMIVSAIEKLFNTVNKEK